MALESNRDQTYPHDYRLICAGREAPTVVGGQAVNLWAISYLDRTAADLRASNHGSKDLDILADKKVIDHLKTVPGWVFRPNNTKNWTDSRQGFRHGTSEDGRKLLVEVLHSVHGLEKTDLARVETVEHRGHQYRVLDPVVMLKAKAANVRDLKQDDTPPRHDGLHLQLIARCVPLYLRDVHQAAVRDPVIEKESLSVLSYAFKMLQDEKTARTLHAEGIAPASLIPAELKESPLARIRAAFEWQFRLLEKPARKANATEVAPAVTPPAAQRSLGATGNPSAGAADRHVSIDRRHVISPNMANLDTTRFDGLPETEILRRIGALLAVAIVRSGRLRSGNAKVRADRGDEPDARIDPLRLIADPLDRRIAEYLRFTGAASPVELRRALGMRPRSLTRALGRLRRSGLCEVVGQTRAARYQLRSDFAQN